MNNYLLSFLCRILASGLATLIYILITKMVEHHKKKMIKEAYHLQVLTGKDIEIIDKVLNSGVTYAIYSSDKSDVLFLNFYGNPLSRQGYWKIVKHYIESCEIVGNITPQTIRHCFALHLLTNGADIESVSEMLGHSDIASTKIYYDVMNDKIKQVYRKTHPRA